MSKYIKVLFLFSLLVSVPFISNASFDVSLKYGSKGDDVKELQEFLIEQEVCPTLPITGNFYSLTLKCVKAFQTLYNISPISGYFGVLSRAKANSLLDLEVANNAEIVEMAQLQPVTPTQPTQQTQPIENIPQQQNTSQSITPVQQPTQPITIELPKYEIIEINNHPEYVFFKENNPSNDILLSIVYQVPAKYSNGMSTYNDTITLEGSNQMTSCESVKEAWLQFKGIEYSYPCPDRNNEYIYLVKNRENARGIITDINLKPTSNNAGVLFLKGTKILYYKTMQGIEYRN